MSNYVQINTSVAGKIAVANVKHILFTQESVSHNFSGDHSDSTISSLYHYILEQKHKYNVDSFNVEFLKHIGISKLFYTLEVLVDINNQLYSCNNRRLCLLKNLVNVGFDGNIQCKAVNKCHHTITIANNVFVQKGNHNTSWCL